MKLVRLSVTRGLLLVSGLLAATIAVTIIFAPEAFYAGYGIEIGSDVNLANEMKAPMGMLFLAGLLMSVGAMRPEFAVPSLTVATMTYLSFGLSRLASMAIDGIPDSGLVSAAVLEIAIGLICLVDLAYIYRIRPRHHDAYPFAGDAASGEGAA